MMRISLLILSIFYFSSLYSQKDHDIQAFGIIDKAELQMSECDFDKNAEAVVLFDIEEVRCLLYAHSVYSEIHHHIRIKILKNKGLERADIKIPFLKYQNTESIGNIDAQTYNLDPSGNIIVTKLEKKYIFDKVIDKRVSEMIFTFPEVKVGSIIEYEFKESASVGVGLKNWYFQHSIPVKLSRYTIDFPSEIEVSSQSFCTLPVDQKKKSDRMHSVSTYSMVNIPALRDEPFISCEEDYLQRVETRIIALNAPGRRIDLTRSWPVIVNSMMEDQDFGRQLFVHIPRTDDLEQMLEKINDPYQKMIIIHRYVLQHMGWNGYSNIWANNGVKSAWKDKKGTSGEINLILINLLKDAGLNAYPILVSTRLHGRIKMETPAFSQFNKVMAYVEIKDQYFVLDATDKYASPKLIPIDVMYSMGLIIERFESFEWGWKSLWDEKQRFNQLVLLNGSIDTLGILTGNATVSSTDYSRCARLRDLGEGR
ncbi:MAG TPA: DUF3857 domain-containing protein, partial [Puia sp.]|nr:DUF3857 domain-containing protein [Puia sp.]